MNILWVKLYLLKVGQKPNKPKPFSFVLELIPKRISEKNLDIAEPNIYK